MIEFASGDSLESGFATGDERDGSVAHFDFWIGAIAEVIRKLNRGDHGGELRSRGGLHFDGFACISHLNLSLPSS